MSVYLMLTSLTDEGRKITDEDPETLREINKEVEFMGAKIIAQYALLGSLTSSRYSRRRAMRMSLSWQRGSVAKGRCRP